MFEWDPAKSEELKRRRGVSFEEIVDCRVIGFLDHPARPHQRLVLFERGRYVWVAPCVVMGETAFLKTLFASRKHTRQWKRGEIE